MKNSAAKIIFITALGHGLVHTVTLIYPAIMVVLLDEFNVTLVELGKLGTIQFLFFGLSGFPAGWLVDRAGSRNVLILYFLGILASVLLLVTAHSLPQLGVGLGILGLCAGLYHPAGLNLISNTKNISKNMGYHGISGSIGLTIGPLLGGTIAGFYDWRWAFGIMGILALLGAAFTLFRLSSDGPEKHPADSPRPSGRSIIRPVHLVLFTISALWGFAHHGIFTFMPVFFSQISTWNIAAAASGGVLTAAVLILGVIGQITGGKLGEIYPRKYLLVWVMALNIPFLLIMGLGSGWIVFLAAGLLGAVNFTYQPINNSFVADITPKQHRGFIYGISFGLGFGVGSFSSVAGGYIGEYLRLNYIFPAMAIILIPAVLLSLWIARNTTAEESIHAAG